MSEHEYQIREPYPSDFDEPKFRKKTKEERTFDFDKIEPGPFQYLKYLEYKGIKSKGMPQAMAELKEQARTAEDEKEKKWVDQLIANLETRFGQTSEEKLKPTSPELAANWLKKIIDHELEQRIDAERSGDMDMAAHHEAGQHALEKLRNNIKNGRWSNIDIDDEGEFSPSSWLASAEAELKSELKKKVVNTKLLKAARNARMAWKKIELLIRERQG
ncbi:hypothetical protein KJ969_02580 [Patescibacteria group bacterium]|nr:hypothetical protein [Patescibacteria group bacterium]MBU1922377.1 hypothetical protein [Patescibacteria group bacterium]